MKRNEGSMRFMELSILRRYESSRNDTRKSTKIRKYQRGAMLIGGLRATRVLLRGGYSPYSRTHVGISIGATERSTGAK
jgi:hypothetical protein